MTAPSQGNTRGTDGPETLADRIADLSDNCRRLHQPVWSDFLDPLQLKEAKAVIGWSSDLRYQVHAGYTKAERCRVVVFPDYYITETIQPALAFLEIRVADAPLEPSDFLNALLSLGIDHAKIGDLLCTGSGCQVVLAPEIVDFIHSELTQIAGRTVQVLRIDPEQLMPPGQRSKEIRTTVASLRLDTIAAFGFGDSRTRMTREIQAERAKVNWQTVPDPAYKISPGDIISMKGRGRILVRELTGRSKKGRLGVILERYY